MNCALCGINACTKNLENAPINCPSLDSNIENIKKLYKTEENYKLAKLSTKLAVEKSYTRIEETMNFAKEMGYKKIGLAFCSALKKEAEEICKIFKYNDFEVESITCKVGGLSKDIVDIEDSRIMCNPITQAEFLNNANTDFNVVVGLCVGHDSLFIKYSKAPVTVLIVKDKVLAHNPIGAVYNAEGYYKNKLFPPKN